jgi:hypothetical protein
MDAVFIAVIAALAIAAVAYFVVATHKHAPQSTLREAQTAYGKMTSLRPGDIVRYALLPERSFTVSGFIDYREDGATWREVRLADGDFVRWLEIEEDDFTLEMTLWEEIDLAVPRDGNLPDMLEYEGRSFRLKESGLAQASLTGFTGKRQESLCRYWEYASGDGRSSLAVEQWGGEFEVSLGEPVREAQIEVFPAG